MLLLLVEVTGFEHATSASRTQRSTKLSHTSIYHYLVVNHKTHKTEGRAAFRSNQFAVPEIYFTLER